PYTAKPLSAASGQPAPPVSIRIQDDDLPISVAGHQLAYLAARRPSGGGEVDAAVVGELGQTGAVDIHDEDLADAVAGAMERDMLAVRRPVGVPTVERAVGELGQAGPICVHDGDLAVPVAVVAGERDRPFKAVSQNVAEKRSADCRPDRRCGLATRTEKDPDGERGQQSRDRDSSAQGRLQLSG